MNESNKCYIGIDVGNSGFIAAQYNGEFEFFSLYENDLLELSKFLDNIKTKYQNIMCIIEDVHAIYGSSASNTFKFGYNKGYLVGFMVGKQMPYTLVPPKVWQKEIWTNGDLVINRKKIKVKGEERERKEIQTKETSINAAKRIFPNIDFRRNERCKSIDDNKVDAILMSEYGRRKNL